MAHQKILPNQNLMIITYNFISSLVSSILNYFYTLILLPVVNLSYLTYDLIRNFCYLSYDLIRSFYQAISQKLSEIYGLISNQFYESYLLIKSGINEVRVFTVRYIYG